MTSRPLLGRLVVSAALATNGVPSLVESSCSPPAHSARKYNGEWIPADGTHPMILSGWRAHAIDAYEGTMTKGGEVRTDCECYEDDYNGLTAE